MENPDGAYGDCIRQHYGEFWPGGVRDRQWHRGPVGDLPRGFSVIELEPSPRRRCWTYATVCMSRPSDPEPIELHLFSPSQDKTHSELLTAVAHYHRTGHHLNAGHTVNFGRP